MKIQLLILECIENKQNILCIGAVGTDKIYMATTLGVKVCSLGKKSAFLEERI